MPTLVPYVDHGWYLLFSVVGDRFSLFRTNSGAFKEPYVIEIYPNFGSSEPAYGIGLVWMSAVLVWLPQIWHIEISPIQRTLFSPVFFIYFVAQR